ncbi:hypothetical protein [Nonomuraea sp. NPDC050786]|uniref:WXG100 family type VII secretion target n=1 Tax=Nonomuraea sp. NPDC050786 TaxID=3154840 RepID=UPI0033F50952
MAKPHIVNTPLVDKSMRIDTSVHTPGFWESMVVDSIDQVKDWIDATNPGKVRIAGMYYTAAQSLLNGFADDLKTKATELAEHYKGPVAVETQKQLQSMHASTRELAQKLGQIGKVLQDYGETLRWAQANVVESPGRDSRSDHDIDWAGQIPFYRLKRGNERAVNHLKEVNQRIAQHFADLPAEMQQAVPDPAQVEMPDFNNGGGKVPPMPNLRSGPGPGDISAASFNPGSVPGLAAPQGPADGYPSGQYPGASVGGGINGGIDGGAAGGFGGGVPGSVNAGDNPYGGGGPAGVTGTTLGANPNFPSAPSSPSANVPDSPGTTLAGYDPSLSGPSVNPSYTTPTTGGPSTGPGGPATGPAISHGAGGGTTAGGVTSAVASRGGGGNGTGGFAPHPAGLTGRGSEEEQKKKETTTGIYEDDDVWGGPEGAGPSTIA